MIYTSQKGVSILGIVFIGIIVILVLSYYHVSIKSVAESPEAQGNFNYVASIGQTVWQKYLAEPLTYLWKEVWVKIFWRAFINNMERIRDGEPTDAMNAAPQVNFNQ